MYTLFKMRNSPYYYVSMTIIVDGVSKRIRLSTKCKLKRDADAKALELYRKHAGYAVYESKDSRTIRCLEADVRRLWGMLIELMPSPVYPKLSMIEWSSWEISDAELNEWKAQVIEAAINSVSRDEIADRSGVPCPLCKRGVSSFMLDGNGFKWPEGLRRHLSGTHRAQQCEITSFAFEQACKHMKNMGGHDVA